jgi:hypothetical protein
VAAGPPTWLEITLNFLLRQFFLGQRYFVEGIATTGRKG